MNFASMHLFVQRLRRRIGNVGRRMGLTALPGAPWNWTRTALTKPPWWSETTTLFHW
jgi:hypothetical protein